MSKNYEEVTFFHVLHSKQDDKWHVKEGNGGTISAYPSKDDAIEKATELAAATLYGKRQVIIHKTNGTFEAIRVI